MSIQQKALEKVAELKLPILPVIKVDTVDDILPIAETLIEGGILGLEITLRTEAGLDAIKLAKSRFPNAIVSAGTVTTPLQLEQVVDAGVDFTVTPGLSAELLETAERLGAALLPGVATPSEIMLAKSHGLQRCKLFPASIVGGIGMLKAMQGPFPSMSFCPTGGLNAENFMDYLSLDNVFCIGGTWMLCSSDGKFDPVSSAKAISAIHHSMQG